MESKRTVWVSICCDLAIGCVKFVAAFFTGSSAMFSEAIHSIVDSVNGFLLLWGRRASEKPADTDHPFGYGKELYFWSLIVAVLIFAIGGGASLYEGVLGVVHPRASTKIAWDYGVLAFAAVFEVVTVVIAARDFRRSAGRYGYWKGVRTSKDPTLFTVLLDNVAAVFGVVFAFLGIFLGRLLHRPYLDGLGAILVGVTLAAVAVILAIESKGLLIGEGVDRKTREKIRRLAAADPAVERVGGPLTMYFGPTSVLLALEVQFRKGLSAGEVTSAVDRLEKSVRGEYPFIERIFIEAESLGRTGVEAS
ncbi:MAG: cation diffusion facilitator family transporter [Bryobacteraceae bacterium]